MTMTAVFQSSGRSLPAASLMSVAEKTHIVRATSAAQFFIGLVRRSTVFKNSEN
jgi:hypothetical protein